MSGFELFVFLIFGTISQLLGTFPKIRFQFVLAYGNVTDGLISPRGFQRVPYCGGLERFPEVRVTKRTFPEVRVGVRFGRSSLVLPPSTFPTKFEVNRLNGGRDIRREP